MGGGSSLNEFLILVVFWFAAVILVIGLCMVLIPAYVIRLGQRLNKWVSTDDFFGRLDTPRYGERFFYRHHIFFGLFIIVAGSYILYTFMFVFDADKYALPVFTSRSTNEWLTDSLVFMNILFSVLILIIGVVITLRPSLLKNIESGLNRWLVTDQSIKKLDMQLQTPDTMFSRRPRTAGFIIMICSIYILFNLWPMM